MGKLSEQWGALLMLRKLGVACRWLFMRGDGPIACRMSVAAQS